MKKSTLLHCFLTLALHGFIACAEQTMFLSESLSTDLHGKRLFWEAHTNLGSALEAAVESETGRQYISASGTQNGLSTVRLNLRHETVDLSAYKYMNLFVKMKEVTDFRVTFNARADAEDEELLFPAFSHLLGRKDEAQWYSFYMPLRSGNLGLAHRQTLAAGGIEEKDLQPGNFAAVLRHLQRIDFSFYGNEGKQLSIDRLYFSNEGPWQDAKEGIVGAGLQIQGIEELLENGRVMLTALPDGARVIHTLMGKNTSLDLVLSADAIPAGSRGVFIINLYDQTTNVWERQFVDIAILSNDNDVNIDRFFLNGRERAGSHFRKAVWRERVAFIKPELMSGGKDSNITLRLTANTDFRFRRLEFLLIPDEEVAGAMLSWMDKCKSLSLEHITTVVALALLEDELRQYERGIFYSGREGEVERLKEAHAVIITANEQMESLLDTHYYLGPVSFARDRDADYRELTDRLSTHRQQLHSGIQALRIAIGESARENGFNLKPARDIADTDFFQKTGVPFIERIVFLMFANSRWGNEGLRDGPGGGLLYDVMKMCGFEARFALANTLDFSLQQRQDDQDKNWSTVPGLWLMHQGINHSLASSPKLQELFDLYGEELLIHTPAGPADMENRMYQRWQFPGNIFHPAYRKYIEEYVHETAEEYADDLGVIALTTLNEANFWAKSKDYDRLASGGYSDLAEKAWHLYLEEKHGDVSTLNRRWGTEYTGFAEIPRPPCSRMEPDRQPSGMVYDFETFRRESFAEFINMMNEQIKAAAPEKLTWAEPWSKFNGEAVHGKDFLKVFSSPYLDIVHAHHGASPLLSSYNHMFQRYLGKIIAHGEFTYLEPENRRESSCSTIYNAGMRNIWNEIAWDKRGIVFWPSYFYAVNSGGYGSSFHDRNFVLPVRAAGAARVMKEKAELINDILFNTEIVSGGVAIMQPSTALLLDKLAPYPDWVIVKEAEELFNFLYRKGITSFIVAEEYIADGRDELKDFGVLIIPHATYVDERLDERLLAWMEAGGTVISVGPYGLYNQYARPNRRLLQHLFGDIQVEFSGKETAKKETPTEIGGLPLPAETSLAGWSYTLKLDRGFQGRVDTLMSLAGGPGIIETSHGKGRFIMTGLSLAANIADAGGSGEQLGMFFMNTVLEGIKRQLGAVSVMLKEGKDVGLILRDDGKGERYLIALNQSATDYNRCTIEAAGVFTEIVDLTTAEGMKAPLSVNAGNTLFETIVAPGEGIVFSFR